MCSCLCFHEPLCPALRESSRCSASLRCLVTSVCPLWWVCGVTSLGLFIAFPCSLTQNFCVHISHSYIFHEVPVQVFCTYFCNWLVVLSCEFSLRVLDTDVFVSHLHCECFLSVSALLFYFLTCQRGDVLHLSEVQ